MNKEAPPLRMADETRCQPIGWVRNSIEEPIMYGWEEVVSDILIKEELSEALDGLEGYSHVMVLFWMHYVGQDKRSLKKVHPRDRLDLPEVGIFATRTQYRPNPIGLTTVKLIRRSANVLRVVGLDAVDGTPILDIKPFSPRWDPAENCTTPPWTEKL